MSGGTWEYEERRAIEVIEQMGRTLMTGNLPLSGGLLRGFAQALGPFCHDLDWHFACDRRIEDLKAFDDRLAFAILGAMEPPPALTISMVHKLRHMLGVDNYAHENWGLRNRYSVPMGTIGHRELQDMVKAGLVFPGVTSDGAGDQVLVNYQATAKGADVAGLSIEQIERHKIRELYNETTEEKTI